MNIQFLKFDEILQSCKIEGRFPEEVEVGL